MAMFGHMLTPEVEESVFAEAQALESCNLQALLREQAEAVQHILAVSTALAQRVKALHAQTNGQHPTDIDAAPVAAPPPPPATGKHRSNGLPAEKGLAEPLLSPSESLAEFPEEGCFGCFWPRQPKEETLAQAYNVTEIQRPAGGSEARRPSLTQVAAGGLFPNVEHVQGFIKNCLRKDPNRVEDLYKKTGCSQAIAQDAMFKNLTFFIIFLNTIWIGYDTDNNHAAVLCDADLSIIIAENFFCTFFSLELAVRFLAFESKKDAFTNSWFVFDALLVALMVWETWVSVVLYLVMHDVHGSGLPTSILRIFRLFRLTRVARLGRLINAVPELMLLAKSMFVALRSVGSTLTLMLVIVYVFSVLFTQLLKESSVGQGKFETVPMSINYLLVGSVFPDQKADLEEMLDENVLYYLSMIVFLLLGSITVMNMLIGVLCEVVSIVAECEKREEKAVVLRTQLLELMAEFDEDNDSFVDMGEMTRMLQNEEAVKLLDEAGVDVEAMVENRGIIFQGKSKLDQDEFISAILRFRHDITVTHKDLVDLQKHLGAQLDTLLLNIRKMNEGWVMPQYAGVGADFFSAFASSAPAAGASF